jgi:hypothetical protein
MSTLREQILEQIKTTIESVSTPTNLSTKVARSLRVAVSRRETPMVTVEPVIDAPNNETIARLTWRLTVRVSLIIRGDVADQVADPIIESIHAAIMADQTLGGLAMGIEPGLVNFDLLDSDGGGGIIPINYIVSYQTKVESMSTI